MTPRRLTHALVLAIALAAGSGTVAAQENQPAPEIIVSDVLEDLPQPVLVTRDRLIAAARSGDTEALRAVYAGQEYPPNVSFGGADDPVAHLRAVSADGEGRELLAVLLNLFEAPYAVVWAGTEQEAYVWPAFAAMTDLGALAPADQVAAYRIISPEELTDQIEFGGWIYWRTFIGKDGTWQAFIAGD